MDQHLFAKLSSLSPRASEFVNNFFEFCALHIVPVFRHHCFRRGITLTNVNFSFLLPNHAPSQALSISQAITPEPGAAVTVPFPVDTQARKRPPRNSFPPARTAPRPPDNSPAASQSPGELARPSRAIQTHGAPWPPYSMRHSPCG